MTVILKVNPFQIGLPLGSQKLRVGRGSSKKLMLLKRNEKKIRNKTWKEGSKTFEKY